MPDGASDSSGYHEHSQSMMSWIATYRNEDLTSFQRKATEKHLFDRLFCIANQIAKDAKNGSAYDAELVALDSVKVLLDTYIANPAITFANDGHVISLLQSITINSRKESVRKNNAQSRAPHDRDGKLIPILSLEITRIDRGSTTNDPAILCEQKDELEYCLCKMPEQVLKDVFLLSLEGMTRKEIGNQLGMDENQVRRCERSIQKILAPLTKNRDL